MKSSRKHILATILPAAFALLLWANDGPIKKVKVGNRAEKPSATIANYKPSELTRQMARRLNAREATTALADFSVQQASAQTEVWSENFDNGTSGWTFNQGEGDVVTFTLETTEGNKSFKEIDENDVQSLHIDGPYQTFKRTIGSATSPEISVPNNGQFHCYLYCNKNWNDYVVMTISVSTDDFATEEALWNSTLIETSGGHWEKISADLGQYAGENVKIRFTYGPGTSDNFNVGGYMGDFYLDNVSVTGVESVDHVTVVTGEEVGFVDLSKGEPSSWEWSFSGQTNYTSNMQNPTIIFEKAGNYDASLKVTYADGTISEVTKPEFVRVEGQLPTAQMITPASFRDVSSRVKMVAPLVPVQYHDASTGYPDEWTWAFERSGESLFDIEYSHERDPWMTYNKLDTKLYSVLTVTNDSGTTYCTDSVLAKYSGLVSNFVAGDYATTYDMGEATFPGAMPNSSPIKGYAEKFSKPSRPIKIYGAYVYFTKAQAEDIYEQTMPIAFQLCESENGVPGRVIDSDFWTIPEIGYAIGANNGYVTVEFTEPHVLNDEFFITIDGFTSKNETFEVSFAMAPLRDHDNTAYMLYNDQWRPMTGYFAAAPGGQTSFLVMADIAHSVMSPIVENEVGVLVAGADSVVVDHHAGVKEQAFFSYLGRKNIQISADWCRILNEPNGLTLDTLQIEYDELPDGIDRRECVVSFSDGADEYDFRVIQMRGEETAIADKPSVLKPVVAETVVDNVLIVDCPDGCLSVEVVDATGKRIARKRLSQAGECRFDSSRWAAGIYIVRAELTSGTSFVKIVKR